MRYKRENKREGENGCKWRVEFSTKFMKTQGIEVERGHAKVIGGGTGG